MRTYPLILIHLIIYILFLLPTISRAQESFADHYNPTYLTMDEGLSCNFIDDIYQDSRGFLWISMAGGGLSRYDGYEFTYFTPNTLHCKLKSNFIRYAREDNFRRLWVVSEGGTDIIDLNTLSSTFPADLKKALASLEDQPASYVTLDSRGCIWLHSGNRLHRIAFKQNGEVETIHSLSHDGLYQSELLFKDLEKDGNVWIGLNGKVCKVGLNHESKLEATPIADCLDLADDIAITDFIAKENEIWITTGQGLYRYDKNLNVVRNYKHVPGDPNSLSQDYLTGLAITENNQLMIASLCGLNIYNPLKDNFEQIRNDLPSTKAPLLNSNFLNCIFLEDQRIWIGTESGGINKLTPKRISIQNFVNNREDPSSLSRNPVNSIYEDIDGTLWVGTVEGGLNRKEAHSNQFTHYTTENGNLSHNSVSTITADPQGRLWIGTWGGGINLLDRKNPKKRLKTLIPATADNYPIYFVGSLTYDSLNNGMWIGANQGLYFYDFAQEKVISSLPNSIARNIHGCIGSIIDHEGNLWIGCLEGVYVIDLHSRHTTAQGYSFRYRHLKYKLDRPESKLIEKVSCFYESPDGTLWLGSNGYGIYRRTISADGKEQFTAYTTTEGLPNNSVHGILGDNRGYLWLATNNGLSRFSPDKLHFINFTHQDGLAGTQFYWNAACGSGSNQLYFGHVKGLLSVDTELPSYLPSRKVALCFTRLLVDNQEIKPGNSILPQDIATTRSISIHESTQSFSLEFSALAFESGSNNIATYSYRLNGFDKQWISVPANRRFASYTNLSPGKYTLQVKYTPYQEEGEKEQITELEIIVRPYFYKTTWFILLILVLASISTWQLYQWRIRSLKQRSELLHRTVEQRTHELKEQKQLLEEKTEELSQQNRTLTEQNEKITRQKAQLSELAHKVQALTLDKISFFTNITHEFRTPITLIIGPIERALKLSYNPQVIEQLHFVERNSKYLLSLVNQLMDFRKVESGKLEIACTTGNFDKFTHELVAPFIVFARERNIELKCYIHMSNAQISYDEEAMHKVLTNLLSNAIKFTPDGGCVSLFVALLPPADNRDTTLYISVRDTGNGIPEASLAQIFNRFYQSQNQIKYPMYGQSGSGIGLYLCKRIVQAMKGTITVRNNRTTGCTFRLLLPTQQAQQLALPAINNQPSLPQQPQAHPAGGKKPLSILIVEDNRDMRAYIHSILREKYNVQEAGNGEEALAILLGAQPIDFIVSDLMMPVMDGIELSRRVKENFVLSHIPFLMLTAKTSQEARIESYRIGVDEYLLKPFDETLLLARIENILETRKRYQQKFTSKMDTKVLNIEENSSDNKFLNKAIEVMKEHYKNSYFEVSDFCEAMGVSKTLLNMKLQNLAGQSAGQFIRCYRLNLAHNLILQNRGKDAMNVSEIAYEAGFNDPKYFSRCFTKQFNITPSAMLEEDKNGWGLHAK